ncbi:MAG: response regulator transcription factor [Saprospiraceae bacterium]|nr:response regulator transcription factor [Saprospiraceae bacterium]
MKCLIVDDDSMARAALERLCSKQEQLEIMGTCESGEEALKFFKKEENEVELLFLDMEMPGISGLELLDRLTVLPMVIFTTSKVDYAFDAFEYGAIDFLKKPISQPRFDQAMLKVTGIQVGNQQFLANSKSLYVRTEGKFVRLDCEDILFFENVGDYVRIRTATGSNHIIHGTLRGIDERLNDPRFLKVHRSYIVNLDRIVDIEENTLVIEKTVIPISRAHKPILMNRLRIL